MTGRLAGATALAMVVIAVMIAYIAPVAPTAKPQSAALGVLGVLARQASGHPAWLVTFLMTYPDAASEGLAWTSEAGAAVVADRAARCPRFSTSRCQATLAVATLINSLSLASPG
ncbi:MAG TPA: hypothetical protein VME19_09690 [Streptosporangiaceae bacterium]|nr:hypothetical protein [Streptosporangiaceae bacterium]